MSDVPKVEGQREVTPSNNASVNLDVDGKNLAFPRREDTIGKVFYFIFVSSIILAVLGAAWTILDVFWGPAGKWDWFMQQFSVNPGIPLAILGAGFFGLLMLIILFYNLYKGGTHTITKALFSAKKVYSEMKTTMFAKIITGGIMISIFLIAGGMIMYLSQFAISGGAPIELTTIFDTTGKQVLLAGILAVAFTSMAIAFAYLWNAGNILLTRKFFAPKK